MIRLGCFALQFSDIDILASAGYDTAEFNIEQLIEIDDAQFQSLKKRIKDSGIGIDVLDNPYPLSSSIASLDLSKMQDFMKKGAYRASEIGCNLYLFGNGKSRSIPADDPKGGRERILEAIALTCEIGSEFGIDVMLEPIGPTLTNFCTTIEESVGVVKELGIKNLTSMCDLRHVVDAKDDLEDMVKYSDYMAHLHIDNPTTVFPVRYFPTLTDGYDYSKFFDLAKKMNYDRIISVEAKTYTNYEAEIKEGLKFFKYFGITGVKNNK